MQNSNRLKQNCYLIVACFYLLLSHKSFAAALQDEITSGQLNWVSDEGRNQTALHLGTTADVQINGLLGTIRLEQQFSNQTDSWQEAIYTFPLPDDAAVSQLKIKVGERIIHATVREKQQAKKLYQAAKKSGKVAALTQQHRANIFSQRLANIAPNETVSVELEVELPVSYRNNRFEIILPLTMTPRYIPGKVITTSDSETVSLNGKGWATATDIVPDADKITPFYQPETADSNHLSLNIEVDAGVAIDNFESPSHQIVSQDNGKYHYRITPSDPTIAMDRDFILRWHPKRSDTPVAAAFVEQVKDKHYALLMLQPPTASGSNQLPRELIFVIDTSGSMAGQSIIQAKEALSLALNQLRENDSFNLISFNSTATRLFPYSQPASNSNLTLARKAIGQLVADGGTEMLPALQLALDDEGNKQQLRQVVFITDGSVGNEQQLLESIHSRLKNSRLFTVGIGSAPSGYFMRKAAEFGRGSYVQITSLNQVWQMMSDLFSQMENVALTDIGIDWPLKNTINYPSPIPDLYAGTPILIVSQLDTAQTDIGDNLEVKLSGRIGNAHWQQEVQLNLEQQASARGIAKLWARKRVESLMDEEIRGADSAQIKQAIIDTALTHQIVTQYTSLIAIEDNPVRPVGQKLESNQVPLLKPAGSAMNMPYPVTATNSQLLQLFGLLCVAIALLLRRRLA